MQYCNSQLKNHATSHYTGPKGVLLFYTKKTTAHILKQWQQISWILQAAGPIPGLLWTRLNVLQTKARQHSVKHQSLPHRMQPALLLHTCPKFLLKWALSYLNFSVHSSLGWAGKQCHFSTSSRTQKAVLLSRALKVHVSWTFTDERSWSLLRNQWNTNFKGKGEKNLNYVSF